MNTQMVTQKTLNTIAQFPVNSVIEDSKEISLLGVEFNDVLTLDKKAFWGKYREATR